MCGIAGIFHFSEDRPVDKNVLRKMTDAIAHRGPNDEGFYFGAHIGLGHRRLSIIDLSGGHQPLSNEDDTIWTVFNGEVYNYKDLRKGLMERGHTFKTHSDTEVLVHLYEEKKEDFASYCNGIFGAAIWDSREARLTLVRDHLGVKPLYWCEVPDGIVFASEIKAILQHPDVVPEVNEDVLTEYFVFRYISGTNTMFRGIKRLAPGSRMIADRSGIKLQEYWRVPVSGSDAPKSPGMASASDHVDRLLNESVEMQLMSDVPLGAYCSGGIDSSLMTAMSAPKASKDFNTFCVGFENPEWDETSQSRLTASRYNTVHREIIVKEEDFSDPFFELAWQFDEPLSHPNSIPIYHLSRFAREHVVVTLTGEGADELFAGYPRYNIVNIRSWLDKAPKLVSHNLTRFLRALPSHRTKKLAYGISRNLEDALLLNSAFNHPDKVNRVLAVDMSESWADYRRQCLADGSHATDVAGQLQHLEIRTYLVSALDRLDRMSMAVSMESRVPFLDYRLVEYAAQLPTNHKLRRFRTKYVLKKIAERYVPKQIVHRRKSGFGVPLADWFRRDGGLGALIKWAVYESQASKIYFNSKNLREIFESHQQSNEDHSEFLWLVLSFCAWHEVFIEAKR